MAVLNFGFKIKKYNLGVGTNFKVLYNNVPTPLLEARYGSSYEDQNYLLFASDVGMIARTNLLKRYIGPEPSLTFGLVLKNVGYSERVEKLSTEVYAGISYRPFRHILLSVLVDKVLKLDPKNKRALNLRNSIKKKINLEENIEKFNNGSK